MVSRASGQIQVGDTVRVPWGLGVLTGEVVAVHGEGISKHAVVSVPISGASDESLGTTTVTYPVDHLELVEGQIIAERDVTPPGMDGWIMAYTVQVGDGTDIPVNVWCSGTAQAMAPYNDELLTIVRDRGRSAAVRAAEHAQPNRDARVVIRCDSMGVSIDYEYGRPAARLSG